MLNKCAPGFEWRMATHCRIISFGRRKYPALPKHNDIENGHVRKMIRYLGIDRNCVESVLPNLFS